MQISIWKRRARKSLQNLILGGSWAPFGRGLGQSGASFGHSWPLLGRFGGVRNRAFIEHWSKMGSKRPSGSIWGASWSGLGRFGGGFGRVLGGFQPILGWILKRSGEESGRELKDLGRAGAESLIGAPLPFCRTILCVQGCSFLSSLCYLLFHHTHTKK